jgi:hypothetical protein
LKIIDLNPQYARAYSNRAKLKQKDYPGSLSLQECSANTLDPKLSEAYHNRAILKKRNKDQAGAIQDLHQAAKLYRAQSKTRELQTAIDFLRELGATE